MGRHVGSGAGHPFVADRRRVAAEQARQWITSRLRRAQEAGFVDASIEDSSDRLGRVVQRLLCVDGA